MMGSSSGMASIDQSMFMQTSQYTNTGSTNTLPLTVSAEFNLNKFKLNLVLNENGNIYDHQYEANYTLEDY